ncbi:hypothetical protein [Amycolatopsis sp.]|jgi:uncharacterized membrane protein YtjA (UPF0391 family)|uniref:hypothetical protein n=1 Tax=Amycolatopsis sp. TaxID=37632 RepID=UPI002DF87F03|nr:hypothetical protein [Amycolatopsis sp.]
MAEVKGDQSGITIKTEDDPGFIDTGKIASSLPGPLGSGAKVFEGVVSGAKDGKLDGGEITSLASDGASFVSSCMDVSSIATDPIGWLVGAGLNFLLSVVQPLQDAIQLVSGDGPALANAAGNFGAVGTGLQNYSKKFAEDAQTSLAQWEGPAAEAAARKLGEFANGINGIAGQAGDIAKLLQLSSMVMTVIEEFIKALLTEFITWLVMIWIPALAAAVPTFGGSTAAAGTATGVKGAQTGVRATKQVSKLQKLLDKIQEFLANLKKWFTDLSTNFKTIMDTKALQSGLAKLEISAGGKTSWATRLQGAETGMVGQRVYNGVGESFLTAGKKAAWDTVGLGKAADGQGNWETPATGAKQTQTGIGVGTKAAGYGTGFAKAAGYDNTGVDQSTDETSEDLDF